MDEEGGARWIEPFCLGHERLGDDLSKSVEPYPVYRHQQRFYVRGLWRSEQRFADAEAAGLRRNRRVCAPDRSVDETRAKRRLFRRGLEILEAGRETFGAIVLRTRWGPICKLTPKNRAPLRLPRIGPQEIAEAVDVPIMAWLPQMPGIVLGCAVAWLVATGIPEAACRAAGPADLAAASNDFSNLEGIKTSASQGDSRAQFKLGNYFNSRGDYTNAVAWYRQAAEQGDSDAQLALSSCYANGRGVARDVSAAFHWSKVAARQLARNFAASPEPLPQADAGRSVSDTAVAAGPLAPGESPPGAVLVPAPPARSPVRRVWELQATPATLDFGRPVAINPAERKL